MRDFPELPGLNPTLELLSDLGIRGFSHAAPERSFKDRAAVLDRQSLEDVTSRPGHGPLHSKYIIEEIAVREKEISGITDRLLSCTPDSIEAQIGEVRRLVEEGIQTLQSLSRLESSAAKEELHSHLSAVRMYPSVDGEGWYDIAEGAWDLLGTDPLAPDMRVCEEGVFVWLRGVDLNHRPLGYEPNRTTLSGSDFSGVARTEAPKTALRA